MRNKVLYIAGYGRSGSTLLSILLDNLPGVAALGGVAGLPRYLGARGRGCSCNQSYSDCPLWGRVLSSMPDSEEFISRMGDVQREVEPWNKGVLGSISENEEYSKRVGRFFRSVSEVTNSSVLVDSSKSAYPFMWRPLALSNIGEVDVFVVHLIREAKGVVSSCKKGRNIDIELERSGRSGVWASLIGLAGWTAANLAAARIRSLLGRGKSMVVWYKDLVQSPVNEVSKIIEEMGLSKDVCKIGGKMEVGHLVGGNRVARKNESIKIETSKSVSKINRMEEIICNKANSIMKKIIKI